MVLQELEQLKEASSRLRNKMEENNKKQEEKIEEEKKIVETPKKENKESKEKKTDDKKTAKETKKPEVKKKKKNFAVVNAKNLPLSTKCSSYICRFIKGKTTDECIAYLEEVIKKKKAIPMKGEIPHRKGKIMSGRFPRNASIEFIILLKSLAANANYHEVENPIITEAYANIASRPHGRFGRTRKKRTHVTIKVKERKINEKRENKEKIKDTPKENKAEKIKNNVEEKK
ncbi:MAG: uL22 family ribosomal protein [archaeon]|nr:uL22 family ribosomal protein [archaeon]